MLQKGESVRRVTDGLEWAGTIGGNQYEGYHGCSGMNVGWWVSGKQRKDGEREPRGKLPLEGGG